VRVGSSMLQARTRRTSSSPRTVVSLLDVRETLYVLRLRSESEPMVPDRLRHDRKLGFLQPYR